MKDELAKRLRQLAADIESAVAKLGLDEKQRQLADLEEQVSRPELWNNPDHAQMVTRELSGLKSIVQPWKVLQTQANDAIELLEIIDDELADEFAGQVQAMEKTFAELTHEQKNAISHRGEAMRKFAEWMRQEHLAKSAAVSR